LRFLRDARERFCSRLPGAASRIGPEEEVRLPGLAAAYAVQLERSLVTDPDAVLPVRAAA
jgi:hypothetical protein